MNADRMKQLQEVFDAAIERPAGERAAYVASACGSDEDLRERVMRLLRAEDSSGAAGYVEMAVRRATVDLAAASAREGTALGPYRLLRELGHGGMGTVWLAERADAAYRAKVAIKLVRGGFANPELARRFREERQILADLRHPHVAALLDGGEAPDGTPYLVMEYIAGQPITTWASARALPLAERLRVFRLVCDAVQHAHGSLVVHRDIKPSNILVDGGGVPKLLDFGIAKLLAPGGAETTVQPRAMTPSYASPEQLRGERITVATDVYSLGVVLFELITGVHPFASDGAPPDEVRRRVLDVDPPRASEALRRRVPPPGMTTRAVTGDLDNIIARAMWKEPEARYRSVAELVADLARLLAGEPVQARPASLGYRARKFVTRHAQAVAAAALVLLSLVGGLVATVWQERRARQALAESEAVTAFLTTLFEASDPNETPGRDVTVRSLLDEGERRIGALAAQPRVQARMLDVIASANVGLGEPTKALPLAERSLAERRRLLGDEHLDVAASLFTLAEALDDVGEPRSAIARHREALAIRRRRLGSTDPRTLDSMLRLARLLGLRGDQREGEALAREALTAARNGVPPDPEQVAAAQTTLAIVIWTGSGDLATAESLLRQSLVEREQAFGRDDPRLERSLVPLARVLAQRTKYEEAEALARRALALRTRLYGPDNPAVYHQLSNVAYVVSQAGRTFEAESLYRRAIARYRQLYQGPHPQVVVALNGISNQLARRGLLDSSEFYVRQALPMVTKLYGEHHPDVATNYHSLGLIQRLRGKLVEAEQSLRRAYTLRAEIHGATSPVALQTGAVYADVLAQLYADVLVEEQRYAEADTLMRRILRNQRAAEQGVGTYSATTMGFLASTLIRRGKLAEAESLLTPALAYWRGTVPPTHPQRRAAARLLSTVFERTARATEAAKLRAQEGGRAGG